MREPRRPRLAWLILLLMLVSDLALGEKWDVPDTHGRLDRIYKELGIEREQQQTAEGCSWQQRKDGQDPKESQGCSGGSTESLTPPRLPVLPPWLGYLLVSVILAGMLIPLVLTLRRSFRQVSQKRVTADDDADEDTADERARQPWVVDLSQCRYLIEQGRLPEAFAALHRLTLLGLEQGHHLTLDGATTNWEYVRRLASKPQLRDALAAVTRAAEQSVLGQRPPALEQYRSLERMVLERVQQGGGQP